MSNKRIKIGDSYYDASPKVLIAKGLFWAVSIPMGLVGWAIKKITDKREG